GFLAQSEPSKAVDFWKQILAAPKLESRHYLQAWHFLRQHGSRPREEFAKTVLGVVVEVGMPEGLDLLAAYLDRSARYFNYSGRAVVWDHPDTSLDNYIN